MVGLGPLTPGPEDPNINVQSFLGLMRENTVCSSRTALGSSVSNKSMTTLLKFRWLLPLMAALQLGLGQDRFMKCVAEIEPEFGLAARRSPGGTVKAVVQLDKGARIQSITTSGADIDLAQQVRTILADTSFHRSCEGKSVEIVFTFQLEGTPTNHPKTTLRFRPPNHFVLITQPRLLHYLLAPPDSPPD